MSACIFTETRTALAEESRTTALDESRNVWRMWQSDFLEMPRMFLECPVWGRQTRLSLPLRSSRETGVMWTVLLLFHWSKKVVNLSKWIKGILFRQFYFKKNVLQAMFDSAWNENCESFLSCYFLNLTRFIKITWWGFLWNSKFDLCWTVKPWISYLPKLFQLSIFDILLTRSCLGWPSQWSIKSWCWVNSQNENIWLVE